MKKKLDQYSGPLNPAEIAAGINHANKNAERLVGDAKILFNAGRYPSATALAILSIEESGKASLLRGLAVAKNQDEVKQAWKDYRSHTSKNVMWILPQLVIEGARRLQDFQSLFDKDSEHPLLLDQIKQISLYTDCLGKRHWSFPEEIVDADLATSIIKIAQVFSRKEEVTEREIELWIKHMKPVWKNSPWMDKALSNWYSEMQSEGLKPKGKNSMEQFIRHGIASDKGEKESGGK